MCLMVMCALGGWAHAWWDECMLDGHVMLGG